MLDVVSFVGGACVIGSCGAVVGLGVFVVIMHSALFAPFSQHL